MRVTAKVEYAVRAATQMARTATGAHSARSIAETAQLPLQFTENILADLRRGGLVSTKRGVDAGYLLARPAEAITVADIIRAVEGPLADVHGVRPEELEYEPGNEALQHLWIAVRANLRTVLEHVTLAHLASGKLPKAVTAIAADPEAWLPH